MQDSTRTTSRAAHRIAALGIATLASFGLVLGAATPALAHDELIGTSLEVDSSTNELNAITLTFSNDIMDVGTELLVTNEAGDDVTAAAPEVSGPTVTQALTAPLTEGKYMTVWRVVSSDGHPIQGVAAFEVAADGSAALIDAAEEEAQEEEHTHAEDEAEAGHDHEHAEAVTTQANETQGGNGSFPVAAWIAIAVVLVAGIGAGAAIAAKKRKQAAGTSGEAATTATTDGSESSN